MIFLHSPSFLLPSTSPCLTQSGKETAVTPGTGKRPSFGPGLFFQVCLPECFATHVPRSASAAVAATHVSVSAWTLVPACRHGRAACTRVARQRSCSLGHSRDSRNLWDWSVTLCHCSSYLWPSLRGSFSLSRDLRSWFTGQHGVRALRREQRCSGQVPGPPPGADGRPVVLVMASKVLPPCASCGAWYLTTTFSGCSVFVQSVAEKSGGGWGFWVL